MVEIIIVLLIMSVLFFVFSRIFQVKNQDLLYGQTCIENIYGNINSFIDAAARGKSLQISGNAIVYPNIYYIDIVPSTNTIQLNYQEATGWILPYTTFELTGNILSAYNCKTANYDMLLSGSELDIIINKWWTSFILSGGAGSTWSIDLIQCKISTCNQIGQFIIDTRTQSIQKSLCLTLGTGGLCNEWDK